MLTTPPLDSALPLFPLQTVLFPGARLRLRIFEPRYIDLVRDCLRDSSGFGIVPIKDGRDAGAAATPYPVGTCAKICDWDQGHDGLLHIMVEGTFRFRIQSLAVQANQLTIAAVDWLPDPLHTATSQEFYQLQALLNKLLEQAAPAPAELPAIPTTASALAYCWTQFIPLTLARKAELLSLPDDHAQLSLINAELAGFLSRARRE